MFNFKPYDYGNTVFVRLEEEGKNECEQAMIKVVYNEATSQWELLKREYTPIAGVSSDVKEEAIKLAMRELLNG